MKISSNFDSGSIDVLDQKTPDSIVLKLKNDNQSSNRQWFNFRVESTAGVPHSIDIVEAGNSTFPKGWSDYQVLGSYDQNNWFQVPTEYDGNTLRINHTPAFSQVNYAYYIPYTYARHKEQMATAAAADFCKHTVLGSTVKGRPLDLLTIGYDEPGKKKIWVIARQHPGETMAQWFIEGLLGQLLSSDESSRSLLNSAVFYIVPNMNPDGSVLGNHRTNAAGCNLNRHWHQPSKLDTPEVYFVRKALHEKGVDIFLDIHGDEEIPNSFIMSGNSSNALKKQADRFKRQYMDANNNFQIAQDYDSQKAAGVTVCCGSNCGGSRNKSTATDYVAHHFGCLSLLLEMPYKSVATGTEGQRSNPQNINIELGASIIKPLSDIISISREDCSERAALTSVG